MMFSVEDKVYCTGCLACVSVCPKQCISKRNDAEGFWYPEIDRTECVSCGRCRRVCPVLNRIDLTGIPTAYAAYCKDEKIRRQSSSGGLFTAFAEEVIGRGGVVFGTRFDESFRVVHGAAETSQELKAFRGSKYVQSQVGDTYRQAKNLLDRGRLVYFSGTPCQIGGLKSFLGKEYENLICQDLICHGVPSPKVWKTYVDYREHTAASPAGTINFRDKQEGWKRFSLSIQFRNGQEYREPLDRDSYLQAFLNNADLRRSCYHCAFKGLRREADLTLADFWGIEEIFPELCDDKGISLLLVQSEKGYRLLRDTAASLFIKEIDSGRIPDLSYSACRSVCPSPKRDGFFEHLNTQDFDVLAKQYGSRTPKWSVRRFLILVFRLLGLYEPAKKYFHRFSLFTRQNMHKD